MKLVHAVGKNLNTVYMEVMRLAERNMYLNVGRPARTLRLTECRGIACQG
jgi:hypothetical protein